MELNGHIKNPVVHDIKSEEMEDIISSPPHWLIRYGIGSFLFVFIIVLFACWFIRYPTEIKGLSEIEVAKSGAFANIVIQQADFSELQKYQKVKIALFSFPTERFGDLNGEIDSVYFSPLSKNYTAVARLHNVPSNIFLRSGLLGTGIIVISNKRLLTKIFSK